MPNPAPEFLSLQAAVAGRYSLEREIGRGGMGIVFLARDVALSRPVAIKLLPASAAQPGEMRERFVREARTAAGLFHPNIVPIHLVEEHAELVFFVMAYVEGESVGDRVRRAGPMPPSVVRRMMQEVSWALSYAHEKGVVHRDIKPDNILLERASGRALVTDFGIARVADASGSTGRGELLGTAQYMSPEQATGELVDGRSDLYSLGITAFFALSGKLPFQAENAIGYIHKHVSAAPPRVASVATQAPAKLAEAIDRCMAKDPKHRFASGEALAQAVSEAGVAAQELPPEVRVLLRRIRTASAIIGLGTGTAFIFGFFGAQLVRAARTVDPSIFLIPAIVLLGGIVSGVLELVRLARRCLRRGYGVAFVRNALTAEAVSVIEEGALNESFLAWKSGADISRGSWFRYSPPAVTENPVLKAGRSRENLIVHAYHVLFLGGLLMLAGLTSVTPGLLLGLLCTAGGLLSFLAGPAVGEKSPLVALDWGERLLIGRFGRLLFWFARLGLKEQLGSAASQVGERTEVALAVAIDDLVRVLPRAVRARFPDVRDVVHRLETIANALREREAKLSDAHARVDMRAPSASRADQQRLLAELESTRAATRERLATTVATIETIRLELLRLQAGVGGPDGLTGEIERARELGDAVAAELKGREAVNRLLKSDT